MDYAALIAAIGACLLTLERIVKHLAPLIREWRHGSQLKTRDEQLVDAVVERLKSQPTSSD